MRLFIDEKKADIDPNTAVSLNFDDKEFNIDTMGDHICEIKIKLPMTENNAKIFGYAYDPNEEVLFNNEIHSMSLQKNQATIFAGTLMLNNCTQNGYPKIDNGYFNCTLRRAYSWIHQIKQKMFNEIPIVYNEKFTALTIEKSWENGNIIRFLPVRRDRFHSSRTSNTFVRYEQMIAAHGYHPFIHVRSIIESMINQSGYTLNSEFLNNDLFNSLHISGNYIQKTDTTANMKKNIDFCAARLTNKEALADKYGYVYATPLDPQNSFGAIVETANPNETIDGYKAVGVFNSNNTFSMDGGVPTFDPKAQIDVAFEYNLSFNSEYEIASRKFLCGFDTIKMDDGLEFNYKIPNSFTDHKKTLINGQKYWVKLFGKSVTNYNVFIRYTTEGKTNTPNQTETAFKLITTITGTHTEPITFACSEKIVEVEIYSQEGIKYSDDWALYNELNPNKGSIDIGLIFRTNFEEIKASKHKLLHDISFGGAKQGMKFTIGRKTSVRPILLPHPGINADINFKEVAAHQIRQVKFLEAITQLFNLRFYTDFVNKIVCIEPRDMIYQQKNIVDWTNKVDTQKQIIVAEMGSKLPREVTKIYRDGDGEVAKYNITNRCVYASWKKIFNKYVSNVFSEKEYNTIFTATRSISNEIKSAPSASIIHAGDRARHSTLLDEELNFCPKIVAYVGLVPLKDGEHWGYPSYGDKYPYVTFYDINRDISLRFDDENTKGLHKYFDKEYLTEEYSREITINIWLNPHDIEAFADTNNEGANFRSLFIIKIGDEKHRLRIKKIENYNPNSGESTKCTFFKEI